MNGRDTIFELWNEVTKKKWTLNTMIKFKLYEKWKSNKLQLWTLCTFRKKKILSKNYKLYDKWKKNLEKNVTTWKVMIDFTE